MFLRSKDKYSNGYTSNVEDNLFVKGLCFYLGLDLIFVKGLSFYLDLDLSFCIFNETLTVTGAKVGVGKRVCQYLCL